MPAAFQLYCVLCPDMRIIGETGFGVDIVARQLKQAVELERRLIVRPIEDFDIISEEAFIAHPDVMRLNGVGQHVTPVIVVLDEVACGKARSEAIPNAGDIDHRNREKSGRAQYAFHAHGGKGGFIQACWG